MTKGHFESHAARLQLGRGIEAQKKQGQETDKAAQQDAIFSVPEGEQFADAQGPATAVYILQAVDGQGVDQKVTQQQPESQPDNHGPVEVGRPHEAGKNKSAELAGAAGKGQAVGRDTLACQKIVLFRFPALSNGKEAHQTGEAEQKEEETNQHHCS